MDASDYEKTLDNAGKKTSLFGDLVKANLTSDAIKSGVKKLASAVVEVGKASFEGYSQYEQLVGGVETLFKESAGVVQKYAANAYKTAGLSANQYMSTVTSFSASLLQSLGKDTAAAAEYADMAITDMADNANKMGTSMEAIQNAYQGFAKQNYTMLDNLKLGYGGTKEEMLRLLEDAEKIKAANGEMVTYSIDSFADMVDAIHVVQMEMDITGTTAKEAENTIEGSISMMKAAWTNLATGMADETADMEQLTRDLVDSVGTAAKNIIPRVQQIVTGVGTATAEGISYLREVNGAIGLVVTGIENIGIAAAIMVAGFTLQKIVTGFGEARVAVALLTANVGKANIAQEALNGTLTLGEVAVGLLTGQISLTTFATEAWAAAQEKVNAAIAANPLGALAILVATVVASTKGAISAGEKYMAQLKKTDGTVEGVRAKYNKLNRELAALQDTEEELGYLENEDMQRKMSLEAAIADLEQQLTELEAAENAAKEAMGEFTEETTDSADAIEAAAQTYAETVQGILNDYLDTYESIYDGLHDVGSAFTKVTEATEISWEQAMSNIKANAALLDGIDENFEYISKAAKYAGIDITGFDKMLASMSTEDAAGLLASLRTELEDTGGDANHAAKTLSELGAAVSHYSTAGQDYSQSLALVVEDVDQRIQDASQNYEEAIAGLDQSAEAIAAGKNTMEGLANGIKTGMPKVLNTVDSLASQMKSRLETSFSNFVLTIEATVNVNGSHKYGLDYVPFDGYMAELHKGERVLTAEEASAYRAGKTAGEGSNGITINQYIQTPVETPAEVAAATEAYFQQARWAVAL